MTRRRTTARGGRLLILSALLGLAVVLSASAAPNPGLVDGQPIVFPLIGDYAYTMNFGDPRGQGRHEGIDIEHVPWRTPVVAAESGTVKWWTTSWRAGCMLYLYGKSGTTYLYIHLNNDLTAASEDKGGCKAGIAYAVPNGAKVSAGEQIAWSGDSGDAEGNHHLHFEVHPNDGGAVNPYPYLNAGERLLFPGRLGASFSLGLRGEPVGAGEGLLRIRVTAVRWWPGGQWTSLVRDRVVTLKVAGDASVDESLAARARGAGLRNAAGDDRQHRHGVHRARRRQRDRTARKGGRAPRLTRDAAGQPHGCSRSAGRNRPHHRNDRRDRRAERRAPERRVSAVRPTPVRARCGGSRRSPSSEHRA